MLWVRLDLPHPLVTGQFLRRVNRFAAEVRVRGEVWRVHLPNSGRMEELLVPGAPVRLVPARRPEARTRGRLLLIRHAGRWVGVDSHLPNRLWELVLRAGGLPPVQGVRSWQREFRLDGERVDFRVQTSHGWWLVETKSCNRVAGGVALFPDAPTLRGARHLRLLARVSRRGGRAGVVWFVQRDDAHCLRVDWESDPEFADAALRARRQGVRLVAYACSVSPAHVRVLRRIPVVAAWHARC